MAEIAEAVQKLYETFGRYPRPAVIEICPCGCTKPEATVHLVAAPLRNLRFADLGDYCFSAITTQGSVNDFRYLLPRLLQGIAEEPCGCNPEIVFGKLSCAKWMTWPENEVAAVRTYLKALWRRALISFPLEERLPAFFEIETPLASIAKTAESLDWYLNEWTETTTKEADQHLIQFVTMYGGEFRDGRTLTEAFWADSKPQATALRSWLLRIDTLERVTRAGHLLRSDGFEHLFAPAVKSLREEAQRLG
jgi:hypothetical protein